MKKQIIAILIGMVAATGVAWACKPRQVPPPPQVEPPPPAPEPEPEPEPEPTPPPAPAVGGGSAQPTRLPTVGADGR